MEQKQDYQLLVQQVTALIEDTEELISSLSNVAALLFHELKDLNWAGFYLLKNDTLHLGPFQGNVACVKITVGKGVCGTAAALDQTQCVEDVHQFAGHIACDGNTNSELVIPIHFQGAVVAVLDLDSTVYHRFDSEDCRGLEQVVRVLETYWKAPLF